MASASTINRTTWTDEQIHSLENLRIFFGHQSVGDNIVQGVRDLIAEDSRLQIKLVKSSDPASITGPAFMEAHVGQNMAPRSKNQEFQAILAKGFGSQGGVALLKYCYVDIQANTDVKQLFNAYAILISQLKTKYPKLRIVHVTAPLTTVQSSGKAWVKEFLGKASDREDNRRRNQFNELMRKAYSSEPIFDLADVESTHEDGSRAFFMDGNIKIFTLASEYTSDGGHLNQAGRRAAAQRMLTTLANVR